MKLKRFAEDRKIEVASDPFFHFCCRRATFFRETIICLLRFTVFREAVLNTTKVVTILEHQS